jgi:hypothetical protein
VQTAWLTSLCSACLRCVSSTCCCSSSSTEQLAVRGEHALLCLPCKPGRLLQLMDE